MTEHVEVAVRTPTLAGAVEWVRGRAWIAAWWIAGRAIVIATAVIVHALPAYGVEKQSVRDHVLGALQAWDGRWYRLVASDGYLLVPGRQSDPAFFPLYPLLLRAGHDFGVSYAAAGLVISNIAFLVALAAMHVLTRELLGEALARRTVVYLAILPFGFVFSMDYPESVVLAAIALAAVAALRGRWWAAAACSALAGLGRPEVVLLSVPMLAVAWRQRRMLTPVARGAALGAILAPVAAVAALALYLDRVVHDPLAWSQAERAWGRKFSPLGFVHAFGNLGHVLAGNAWIARDVVAAVVYLALIAVAARAGVPRSWLAVGVLFVVLPLFSGDFDSIARFGLLAPTVVWGLAYLGRTPRTDAAIRVASIVLLVAAVATIPFVFP